MGIRRGNRYTCDAGSGAQTIGKLGKGKMKKNAIANPQAPGGDSSGLGKVYATPRVQVFGKVRQLTTGGTGNANENSQGGAKKP